MVGPDNYGICCGYLSTVFRPLCSCMVLTSPLLYRYSVLSIYGHVPGRGPVHVKPGGPCWLTYLHILYVVYCTSDLGGVVSLLLPVNAPLWFQSMLLVCPYGTQTL